MNIQALMKQAQAMQSEMGRIETELQEKEYSTDIQGVSVRVNGKFEITLVKIDKQLVNQENTEILEDLIMLAVNQCIKQANTEREEKLGALTQGLKIPGMF